jgi:NADH dehydrogenase FAD-containing subunit
VACSRTARSGVLIQGGGFADAYVARLLGRRGATIVSPENFILYTPMLPEAASGTLEPRHVVVPLRDGLVASGRLRLETMERSWNKEGQRCAADTSR